MSNYIVRTYTIVSGSNTGYGFYGINVSTNKFYRVDGENLSTCSNGLRFNTKANLSRFENYLSRLFTDMNALELKKNKIIDEGEIEFIQRQVELTEKYLEKGFEKIKFFVRDKVGLNDCSINLYAVVPSNIWSKNFHLNTKTMRFKHISLE